MSSVGWWLSKERRGVRVSDGQSSQSFSQSVGRLGCLHAIYVELYGPTYGTSRIRSELYLLKRGILRSVDLWVRKCVKSCAFFLRRLRGFTHFLTQKYLHLSKVAKSNWYVGPCSQQNSIRACQLCTESRTTPNSLQFRAGRRGPATPPTHLLIDFP